MNAISPQLFSDSRTATSIYVIFYSDRKMRLKSTKFREGISDQKEREGKIHGKKKSLFTTLSYYATSLFHYGISSSQQNDTVPSGACLRHFQWSLHRKSLSRLGIKG